MEFTKSELEIISNGILGLIDNAGDARKLLQGFDEKSDKSILEYMDKLRKLNSKICNMMGAME